MSRRRRYGHGGLVPALALWAAAIVSLAACTQESGPDRPREADPPKYGSLIVPRVSIEVDPYFSYAYQALGVDENQVAHLALSWAAMARSPALRDWSAYDPHVDQANRRGMVLSVLIEIVHGGEGEAPAWRWPVFPGWEDPDLFNELVRFLREIEARSAGRVGYLWLGEGIDRYAAAYPGDEGALTAFFAALSDSARAIFPQARIGTLITPELGLTSGEPIVRAVLESMDLIGLSVYPPPIPGGIGEPREALDGVRSLLDAWADTPFAILETGYPADGTPVSIAAQAEFAALFADWLWERPENLELVCWSPVQDPSAELTDSLAGRRFPGDADGKARYGSFLSSSALRRIDGTPKLGRQVWVERKP